MAKNSAGMTISTTSMAIQNGCGWPLSISETTRPSPCGEKPRRQQSDRDTGDRNQTRHPNPRSSVDGEEASEEPLLAVGARVDLAPAEDRLRTPDDVVQPDSQTRHAGQNGQILEYFVHLYALPDA